MIVRDEAAVIERCLGSVRPLIDHWVVCDTGSADDTPERIAAALEGVPGELVRRPWVDFGHNRTEAVELARGTADYLLLLDADMVVEVGSGFDPEDLEADGYLLRYSGPLDYRQVLLVRGDLPWRYVGVTHEYLHADVPYSVERLDTLTLRHVADGANRERKLERDRDLLFGYLERHPDEPRARFYLAQSYFDLGAWDEAITWYERRLEVPGWEEETWYARYRIALAKLQRGDPWPEVLDAFLRVYQARPGRLEPLYVLARHYREAGEHRLAHLLSRPIVDAVYPSDVLFVEQEVYRYLLAFEHAICCYWVGDHAEAIRIDNGLLELPDLPPEHVEAVVRNRRFSLDLTAPEPGCLLVRAVESLLAQDAEGFEAVFVDDASTDGSAAAVPAGDPRCTLLANPSRIGPVASVRRAVAERCAPEEVVVVLDGEDRLASPAALATLQEAYAARDAWVTYGQFEHADGRRGDAKPFPDAASFARARELAGHLGPPLTFRAGLFRRLAEQDEALDCLRRPDGSFHRHDLEAVLGPPLAELAGPGHLAFLDPPLCVCPRLGWRPRAAAPLARRRQEPLAPASSWD
jgi:glycosyltransferase involved in cell wall biosynthesis